MKMTAFYMVAVVLLGFVSPRCVAQGDVPLEISDADLLEELLISDEDFSVDDGALRSAPKSINAEPASLKDEAVFFNESEEPVEDWIAEEGDMGLIDDMDSDKPAHVIEPPHARKGKDGARIDVSAYEDVLNENISIRKEAESSGEEIFELRQEIAGYKNTLSEQERQLAESIQQIQSLKKEMETSVVATSNTAQDTPSAGAPADDTLLQAAKAEVSKLQDQVASLSHENMTLREAQSAASSASPGTTVSAEGPQGGSALYKSLEESLFKAKEEIRGLEMERDKLVANLAAHEAKNAEMEASNASVAQREAALRQEIKDALAGQQEYKATIEKLLMHVPNMQEELSEFKSAIDVKDDSINAKDRELAILRQELERRELRIIKSERMAELLEKTRGEVRQVSDKEKRDMHFNMAVVYTKEGNFRAAEKEYLHALRIDPADADSHYNLAILYDDHMGDTRRAASHYRSYLKLAPTADDVDEVKSWLVALEML